MKIKPMVNLVAGGLLALSAAQQSHPAKRANLSNLKITQKSNTKSLIPKREVAEKYKISPIKTDTSELYKTVGIKLHELLKTPPQGSRVERGKLTYQTSINSDKAFATIRFNKMSKKFELCLSVIQSSNNLSKQFPGVIYTLDIEGNTQSRAVYFTDNGKTYHVSYRDRKAVLDQALKNVELFSQADLPSQMRDIMKYLIK